MSKSFKNNEEFVKFIKFIVVGLINTIFQLGIYYFLLFAGVNYNISFAISFIFSVLFSYVFNNKIVFKVDNVNSKSSLIKIYISYGSTFLLGQIMLYLGVEKLEISDKIMPVINIILTTPINFLLNKYFVFKKEE